MTDLSLCIRCGTELTPDICADEFLHTGVCVDCWTPDDEYDFPYEPWEIYEDINYDAAMMDPEANR